MIDMNRMHAFFGKDNAAIHDFLKLFITSTFDLLSSIKSDIQQKNSESVKQGFHRLNGSASNSGFISIHKLAAKAEEKSSRGDWKSINEIFIEIELMVKKLQIEVEDKFKNQ